MDMAFRACCTHAEDCRSLGVRRAYRNAKNRRQQQAERSRKVRCKALPGGKPHQTVSHFADDAPPAHRRAKPHRRGRKQHQPKRRLNGCHTGLPHGKGAAQQQNANELLPILRAMQKRGARRAVDMLIAKATGKPYITELPMPTYDHVPPAPAVKDIKHALLAIGTEGGIVPRGNPDHIEAHNASKWKSYSLVGIETLKAGDYEVAHGGYDPVPGNANPNRVLPLDVARACQKELDFGALLDEYPVTVGNVTAVKSAEKYGHEMGLRLQEKGVQGIVLTST